MPEMFLTPEEEALIRALLDLGRYHCPYHR